MIADITLLALAVCFIFGFMLVYFRNVFLALMAVLQISISFPCMAFVVDVCLRYRPLSVFCACALFVVTGVSSDNIFVVHETWKQGARAERPRTLPSASLALPSLARSP